MTLVNQFTLRGAGGKKDSPQAWLPLLPPAGSVRCWVLAAFVSNAWLVVADSSTSGACPWCDRVGSFDHLVWKCARSPLVVDRPPKPASGLLWRLGWVSCKDELCCLDYIARVLRLLWDMRHGQGIN